MSDAELTISVTQGTSIRIDDELGEYKMGQVQMDALRLDTISVFETWIRNRKVTRREELQVLGHHLYCLLFHGDIELFFSRTLGRVPRGERLRVQLSFDEASAALAALPWEYLWDPRRRQWFSTAVNFVLSRFLPPGEGGRMPNLDPGESPLRILLMVSEPEGLAPVIADPVYEALEKLKERLPIDLRRHDDPRAENFADVLKEERPHVLHFVGHGRFNREASPPWGEIALMDRAKPWCRDQDFAEYFQQAEVDVRLVFLHLCEGAVVDFDASFAGLAPQLIRHARVPAVVAMQYPIENKFAIHFSRNFYEQIASGEPVDRAVQKSRYKLTLDPDASYDSRTFGTPVLFMYSRNGIIRPASGRSAAAAASLKGQPWSGAAPPAPGGPGPYPVAAAESGANPFGEAATVPRPSPAPLGVSAQGAAGAGGSGTLLGARVARLDSGFRDALRGARRAVDERVAEMLLAREEREELLKAVRSILDDLSVDPQAVDERLDRYWNQTGGTLRELVELIMDVLEERRGRGGPGE